MLFAILFGEQQVLLWRRSYDIAPPEIKSSSRYNQMTDVRYSFFKKPVLTESLKDVEDRVVSFWEKDIISNLKANKKILIVASGNSLRALMKYLDNISERDIVNFNIPVAIPMVCEFDKNFKLKKWSYLGNKQEIKKLINDTIKQGKIK